MTKTDKHWKEFGKSNPYFGVLSDDKFKSDVLDDQALAEFFETGRREVAQALARFQSAFGDFNRGTCLDFGCGVGRNTIPLAENFQSVIAIDVSPGMLDEAGRNVQKNSAQNVVFRGNLGEDMFDFVYSNIVLQHIQPARGLAIVKNILRHVAIGGGGMIQLIFRAPPKMEALNRRLDAMPWLWGFRNLRKGRKFDHPRMATYGYPIDEVLVSLYEAGIPAFFSEFTNHSDHIGLKIYFRKPG